LGRVLRQRLRDLGSFRLRRRFLRFNQAHERQLVERRKIALDIIAAHKFNGFSQNLSDEDIARFIRRLQDESRNFMMTANRTRASLKEAENKLINEVSQLSSELSSKGESTTNLCRLKNHHVPHRRAR
jgi:hypothetical protein